MKTITDHELLKIAEEWDITTPINIGNKTAFAQGFRQAEQLLIRRVSQQRELLIAYEIKMSSCSDEQAETKVDSYLASISN